MKKYDIIIIGGGFSGSAAAICAAREGASVLLIEQTNCLGGAATNCLVNPFMPYSTVIDGKKTDLSQGLFREITEKLKDFGKTEESLINDDWGSKTFSEEHLKIILQRMALDAGVELLFHSYLIGAEREGNKIKSVTVANKSGQMTFEAERFIDATGDADLTVLSGFETRLGRDEDNLCQPMTLCFRISGVDHEKFLQERKDINPLYEKFQSEGKIKNPREDVLIFRTLQKGILHFNTTRIVKLNPTDAIDITKAEIMAREQVFEIFEFLKNNFECFKNCHILSTAAQIGVRESRMINGEYILTGNDIVVCTHFEDSIALGNYDIDIHNPEGTGTSHYYFKPGEYYTIPYRTLIPKDAENLLAAGRCISVDHETQASIRIMPIVCCIGEAAGTAAAISVKYGVNVKDVDIKKLRDTLKNNGAVC